MRPTPRRCADEIDSPVEVEALGRSVVSEFESYVKLNKKRLARGRRRR